MTSVQKPSGSHKSSTQPQTAQQPTDDSNRPDPAQENNNTEGSSTAMLNRETHGQPVARNVADRLYSDGSDETATPRLPTLSDDTAGFDPNNRSR